MDSYCEPFLGAAAVYNGLDINPSQCTLGDLNPDIATLHTVVRDSCDELIDALQELDRAGMSTEAGYYSIRARTPADSIERAARTLFLVQHSFRGLYRVNQLGEFNVSWDSSANGRTMQTVIDNIPAASQRLCGAEVLNESAVATVLEHLTGPRAGDSPWVYCDPPYLRTHDTYTSEGFKLEQHEELLDSIAQWTAAGVAVMVSGSDVSETIDLYGAHLTMYRVTVRQACGRSGSRTKSEVIGINYPPTDMTDQSQFLAEATPI